MMFLKIIFLKLSFVYLYLLVLLSIEHWKHSTSSLHLRCKYPKRNPLEPWGSGPNTKYVCYINLHHVNATSIKLSRQGVGKNPEIFTKWKFIQLVNIHLVRNSLDATFSRTKNCIIWFIEKTPLSHLFYCLVRQYGVRTPLHWNHLQSVSQMVRTSLEKIKQIFIIIIFKYLLNYLIK